MKTTKNVSKRIVSFFLAAIMALSSFAVFVFADEPAAPAAPQLDYATVVFSDAVDLRYFVKSDDAGETKLLMWNTVPEGKVFDESTAQETLTNYAIDTESVPGETYKAFTYDKVAAKQMSDTYYVCAMYKEGETTLYSSVVKYSIKQYVENMIANYNKADRNTLIPTLEAMLDYGALAQDHFNYNENHLANASAMKLNVVGGTISEDGFTHGIYYKDDVINLAAPAADGNNVPFSHWENERGVKVDVPYTVKGTEGAMTLTAVYKESAAEPELPAVGSRLIYFEDFEDEAISAASNTVLSSLGWVTDTVDNGAYSNSTASYSIKEKDSSNQLYLQTPSNIKTDSYVIILSSALMGAYHENNYSYQYDLIYESANKHNRYLAIVSEYNGPFYNSFHFRINGSGNNQVHDNNSWHDYEVAGPYCAKATDENAISNKLLNIPYNGNAIVSEISVSVRYHVDWENGNSIYMRVNAPGYPTSGQWVLVSKYDPASTSVTEGNLNYKPDEGGAAIALKVSQGINGYIDNIIVWEGIGDEPIDKSSPLLKSTDTGCSGHNFSGSGTCIDPKVCRYCGAESEDNGDHVFVDVTGVTEVNGDQRCTYCNGWKSSIESGWLLYQLPSYGNSAIHADNLYLDGHGIKQLDFAASKDSLMHIVYGTTVYSFNEYRALLESYGATEVYQNTRDGNVFYQYNFRDEAFVYTYFTASTGEVRIIYDIHSEYTPQEFGYTYEKKEGERTEIYQYGVPMISKRNDTGKVNHGMVYVIKLADNSLFVIDAGAFQYFNDAQVDKFMAFLREVTGTTGTTDTIKIAAWFITHDHGDHSAGFSRVIGKYHEQLDFDRIFFNFPSKNINNDEIHDDNAYYRLVKYYANYLKDDDVKYMKIHTGQSFTLADIKIDVIYTHEDHVNPTTGKTEITDHNNASSVIKITVDGETFMILGDINKAAMNIILENNSASVLKADAVQLAHHVLNDIRPLYNIIQAEVLMVPQSKYYININDTRINTLNTAKQYARTDMIFHQNEATFGIAVEDGQFVKVYENPDVLDVFYDESWNWDIDLLEPTP